MKHEMAELNLHVARKCEQAVMAISPLSDQHVLAERLHVSDVWREFLGPVSDGHCYGILYAPLQGSWETMCQVARVRSIVAFDLEMFQRTGTMPPIFATLVDFARRYQRSAESVEGASE